MAKKRTKKSKPKSTPDENGTDSEHSKGVATKDPEQQIKLLIEKGKKKGFLTYEEMNDGLPEDAVSPSRLDRLLATLDEMGAHAQKLFPNTMMAFEGLTIRL